MPSATPSGILCFELITQDTSGADLKDSARAEGLEQAKQSVNLLPDLRWPDERSLRAEDEIQQRWQILKSRPPLHRAPSPR
jgi:hypothetical protein